MKKLFVVILFLFVLKTDGIAQQGQWSGQLMPGVHHFIIQHGEDLQLTGDQKKEILAISLERRGERQMRQRPDRRDRRQAFRGQRQYSQRGNTARGQRFAGAWSGRQETRFGMQNQIREILTADQVEKLEGIIAERASRMDEIRTLRHDVMIEKAGIEGEKAVQVKSIMDRHAENRPEWNIDDAESTREAMIAFRNERWKHMESLHTELKEILTAAEYENLQSYMMQGRSANLNRERAPRNRNSRR